VSGSPFRKPNGTKSAETVTRYSLENVDFLIARGIKMLVVACNTSTAAALDTLEARYPLPIVGVVAPGARAALQSTRTGRVGVIATEATIASGAYTRALRALRPDLEIYTRPCPLFVPLAEEGWVEGAIPEHVAETYLASLTRSGIDTLVLGCTHYPMLTGVIQLSMGDEVTLVNSAEETAKDAYRVLTAGDLLRDDDAPAPRHRFVATGDPEPFHRLARRFLGPDVGAVDAATVPA